MSHFHALEQALRAWVQEAVAHLPSDAQPDLAAGGLPIWRRDKDGIFRSSKRLANVWNDAELAALIALPTWPAVETALQNDDRLRTHLNQLVGTFHGVSNYDAEEFGRRVLPTPDDGNDLDAAFIRRYSWLERFLVAEEVRYVAVWPLPQLASRRFPIELEPGIELDFMSDDELAAVLDTDVLRLRIPVRDVLLPDQEPLACLRYRYRLPKVIGVGTFTGAQHRALGQVLDGVSDTLQQVLALLFNDPVPILGRANLLEDWIFGSGAVTAREEDLTWEESIRQTFLSEQHTAELVATWRQVRQPGMLDQQRALSLALRRLGYQARRRRVEDEMVDIMVVAEALYLSDLGHEELGFRLALRAATFGDVNELGMTRREVFDLMKAAYNVRSKIVHGDEPKSKDLKVKGTPVSLPNFVQATEGVVRQGLRRALDIAAGQSGAWPPDWDEITLPT
jgi:hypothetical protein